MEFTEVMEPPTLPRDASFSVTRDVWEVEHGQWCLTDIDRDRFKGMYPFARLQMIAACIDAEDDAPLRYTPGTPPRVGDVVFDTEEILLEIIQLTPHISQYIKSKK